MKESTKALKNSIIQYTDILKKETKTGLDVKSVAEATGIRQGRIYAVLKNGSGRVGNYFFKLISIEDLVEKDAK